MYSVIVLMAEELAASAIMFPKVKGISVTVVKKKKEREKKRKREHTNIYARKRKRSKLMNDIVLIPPP